MVRAARDSITFGMLGILPVHMLVSPLLEETRRSGEGSMDPLDLLMLFSINHLHKIILAKIESLFVKCLFYRFG